MKRIAIDGTSKICPSCKAQPGQYHEYGCPLEPCPQCGDQLMHCPCMVLSPAGSIRTTNTLVETMDFDQVYFMMHMSEGTGLGELDQSYLEKAAFTYFLRNSKPEMFMEVYNVHSPEEVTRIAIDLEAETLFKDFEQTSGEIQ